jgi:hypothetical protein
MNANASSETGRMFIQGIIIILGLIGLYYLYQYLFGVATVTDTVLLSKKQAADTKSRKVINADKAPGIYDGGEFSVSTWIYINNWSYRNGFNKHIMSINGNSSFDTIRIYLGATQPKLHVRVHSKSSNSSTSEGENLSKDSRASVFTEQKTGSGMLDSPAVCDLPEVDLQRWIHLTVAVNGRTVDVYLDGKLARSCVLPDYYKVDGGGYEFVLMDYEGFGGYIQSTMLSSAALPPDVVYKLYMAGPDVPKDFLEYLQSFFEPRIEDVKTTND